MRSMDSSSILSRCRASPWYRRMSTGSSGSSSRAGEVERVHGQHQRVAVDVHAYAAAARELALDERCAAARHLVEHRVPGQ